MSDIEWIKKNVVKVCPTEEYPCAILRRLAVNLINPDKLKSQDNKWIYDTLVDNNKKCVNTNQVPINVKIVISNNNNASTTTIYSDQYYFQKMSIKSLDINLSPDLHNTTDNINLIISEDTISNLQYYTNSNALNYTLYMYRISINNEVDFKDQNMENIMKYNDIHLLELSSYYLVKYLCNIKNKNIHLYVYDIEDIKILTEIFDDAIMENSIIGTNVTIYLYIGWFRDYSNKDLFLNYMNLILQMTRYKMRNNNIKKINIQSKINTENVGENYDSYIQCVQVLLDNYITKNTEKKEDYSACLSALKNLEKIRSNTEETKKTNTNIERMNNEYTGYKKTIYTELNNLEGTMTKNQNYVTTKIQKQEDTLKTEIKNRKTELIPIQDLEEDLEELTEFVVEKERDIYNAIDLKYKILSESFFESLQQLSREFNRMKMDSENTTKDVNALFLLIVIFVMFFIILINIKTSKKKK